MLTLDVSDRDTVKEKLEEIYVRLWNQYEEMLRSGADSESFSLFANGPIVQGLMNHWPHLGLRWRKGRSYLGKLNQKWRVFIDTELYLEMVYTTCNIGYASLYVRNFPYMENWYEEYVSEEPSDCPVQPRHRMHGALREFKSEVRYRYDPRQGF